MIYMINYGIAPGGLAYVCKSFRGR